MFPLNLLISTLIKRLINYECKVGGLPKRILFEQKADATLFAGRSNTKICVTNMELCVKDKMADLRILCNIWISKSH